MECFAPTLEICIREFILDQPDARMRIPDHNDSHLDESHHLAGGVFVPPSYLRYTWFPSLLPRFSPVGDMLSLIRLRQWTLDRPDRLLRLAAMIVAIWAGGLALALLPLPWLIVGLSGSIVLIGIMIRPPIALCLIAFAIPFGSLYEVRLGPATVGITEVLIGLMLAAWVVRTIVLRERSWSWPRLSLGFVLFIGVTAFSLLNAVSLPLALKELVKWVEALGVFLLVSNTTSRRSGRVVVACLLLAGAAEAALGIYQFLARSGPEGFALLGRFMRAYGTFQQPNPYAGYLGLVAPLAFALGVWLVEKRGGFLPWLAAGSFTAMAVAIGMSWSRGGWIAFAAAFVAVNLARSRRGAVLFTGLVILATIVGLLGSFQLLPRAITQRLTSFLPFAAIRDVRSVEVTDENYAVLERLAHWEAALDMWRDHPWLGVGFGNYEAVYDRYALPKWALPLGHAHNYYLNIAAETGLFGLIAYLWLWGAALWQTVQAVRRANDPLAKAIALGALGMLVHISVHNLLDNLWVHNLYIHVAIVLGLIGPSQAPASRPT